VRSVFFLLLLLRRRLTIFFLAFRGLIDTPMIGGIKHMVDAAFSNPTGDIVPLNRIGKPQEVASLVAFLLGDEAAFITGTVQVIDGGVAA
jgi:NAD(P)-dependent dehydrogenase (short-subunit alcohol dehydrogenase family)